MGKKSGDDISVKEVFTTVSGKKVESSRRSVGRRNIDRVQIGQKEKQEGWDQLMPFVVKANTSKSKKGCRVVRPPSKGGKYSQISQLTAERKRGG